MATPTTITLTHPDLSATALVAEREEARIVAAVNLLAKYSLANVVADPGDEGAIPVTTSGTVSLVTEDEETRTLAAPTFAGQQLLILGQTIEEGSLTLTVPTAVNGDEATDLIFGGSGTGVHLIAIAVGSDLRWRIAANLGVSLGEE